jgi:hypothetical protein
MFKQNVRQSSRFFRSHGATISHRIRFYFHAEYSIAIHPNYVIIPWHVRPPGWPRQIVRGLGARARSGEKPRSVGPSHSMSAMRLVAAQGRSLDLLLRPLLEHVRYGRSVPRLPPPLDLDPVSLVYPLVATFRLVCAAMKSRVNASGYTQDQCTKTSRSLRAFKSTI